MATYTSLIYLDINGSDNHTAVIAKQGDKNSRVIRIELTKDGQGILVPDGNITLRGKTSNGYSIFNDVNVSSDKKYIIATLSEQVLLTPGTIIADIAIYDNDTVLSTSVFEIRVTEQPYNPDNIMDNDEANALNTLIERVSEIENNAETVNIMLSRVAEIEDLDNFITKMRLNVSPTTTIALDDNGKPLYISTGTEFGGGSFYQNAKDAYEIYISDNVTSLTGAFSGLNNLATVYINNESLLTGSAIGEDVTIKSTDEFHAIDKLQNVAKYIIQLLEEKETENNEVLTNKADKSTTLAGYGIENAYTKTEVEGITKTVTGKGIINLPDTMAGSKLLFVSTDSNYVIKNKNMYEYYVGFVFGATATTDGESYTVTRTKEGDAYFNNIPPAGGAYSKYDCGNKFPYKEGLIVKTIYSDNSKNKTYISYFDENDTCLLRKSYLVDGNTFVLPQVDNAKYFVLRFDIPNTFGIDESITVKIQIECSDTATDYTAPQSNTEGIAYGENTNIICDSECTVKYVPEVYTKSEIKKYIDYRFNSFNQVKDRICDLQEYED